MQKCVVVEVLTRLMIGCYCFGCKREGSVCTFVERRTDHAREQSHSEAEHSEVELISESCAMPLTVGNTSGDVQ